MIRFIVPGEPVPQPRPKITTRGGKPRGYVPDDHPIHAYRLAVQFMAWGAGIRPTGRPLCVKIEVVSVRPKSHFNKSGSLCKGAPLLPEGDADNYAKGILDSMQPSIGNDKMVARLVVEKRYGPVAQAVIEVSEFELSE